MMGEEGGGRKGEGGGTEEDGGIKAEEGGMETVGIYFWREDGER